MSIPVLHTDPVYPVLTQQHELGCTQVPPF